MNRCSTRQTCTPPLHEFYHIQFKQNFCSLGMWKKKYPESHCINTTWNVHFDSFQENFFNPNSVALLSASRHALCVRPLWRWIVVRLVPSHQFHVHFLYPTYNHTLAPSQYPRLKSMFFIDIDKALSLGPHETYELRQSKVHMVIREDKSIMANCLHGTKTTHCAFFDTDRQFV